MGKFFSEILPEHQKFIEQQKIFFVASAPLEADGHINLSPKGYDSFRIISANEVAYLDLTGSGNETSAHIDQNGRLTIMFVAFDGAPNILRLYGKGEVILPGTEKWNELITQFEVIPGARQIIYLKVSKLQTSCGFSIPFFSYEGEREALKKFAEKKQEEGLEQYRQEKNGVSIDGRMTPIGEKNSREVEVLERKRNIEI